MHPYPKVLIAGNQVPHLRSPSAILLYRMFQDWPPDRLVALGPNYHPNAKHLLCRYVTWEPRWNRLERTRFHWYVKSLRTAGVLPLDRPDRLARMIDGFQPDVVVSLMEFQHYYAAAQALARHIRRPFVLLIHDLPELFEQHAQLFDVCHDRTAGRTYRAAAECLPISEPMESELARRWGRRGVVFHPIPSDDTPIVEGRDLSGNPGFTVGYAGSLDSRYNKILGSFAKAIEGSAIRLNLYSPNFPKWKEGLSNTIYRGYFAPADLWKLVIAECDALLLPYEAADRRDSLVIEFSFPSKLPEYLRLGLPVILAVPERSAARSWANAHTDTFVIANNDVHSLLNVCHQLQVDQKLRQRMGLAAKQLYDAEFNPHDMRERFRKLLGRVQSEFHSRDGSGA